MMLPRRFALVRHVDYTGAAGTGVIAYGVAFDDGQVVLRWSSAHRATSVLDSVEDLIAAHGHGETTSIEWIDAPPGKTDAPAQQGGRRARRPSPQDDAPQVSDVPHAPRPPRSTPAEHAEIRPAAHAQQAPAPPEPADILPAAHAPQPPAPVEPADIRPAAQVQQTAPASTGHTTAPVPTAQSAQATTARPSAAPPPSEPATPAQPPAPAPAQPTAGAPSWEPAQRPVEPSTQPNAAPDPRVPSPPLHAPAAQAPAPEAPAPLNPAAHGIPKPASNGAGNTSDAAQAAQPGQAAEPGRGGQSAFSRSAPPTPAEPARAAQSAFSRSAPPSPAEPAPSRAEPAPARADAGSRTDRGADAGSRTDRGADRPSREHDADIIDHPAAGRDADDERRTRHAAIATQPMNADLSEERGPRRPRRATPTHESPRSIFEEAEEPARPDLRLASSNGRSSDLEDTDASDEDSPGREAFGGFFSTGHQHLDTVTGLLDLPAGLNKRGRGAGSEQEDAARRNGRHRGE